MSWPDIIFVNCVGLVDVIVLSALAASLFEWLATRTVMVAEVFLKAYFRMQKEYFQELATEEVQDDVQVKVH